MFIQGKPAPLAASAILTIAGGAVAENAPPLLYDPQQLPAQRGQVQFTLTARGNVDGLILSDGTDVKTPPHLSTALAYSVKAGDAVTIHGRHAAVSMSEEATCCAVVDSGPPGPGHRP
jgi:hypothetical protein